MKRIILIILIAVIAKVGSDRFIEYNTKKNVDRNMQKIAEELNQKLPLTAGLVRFEKIEYSNHVLRYFGAPENAGKLTDEWKSNAKKTLLTYYCGNNAFRKMDIGVEFIIRENTMQSLSDKLSFKEWVTTIDPKSCP